MKIPDVKVWRALGWALAMLVTLAACGGDGTPSTTTSAASPSDDVVFSSGVLPETIPDDFPVPAEAVIGSTLVVRSTNATEAIMRLPVAVEVAVAYYEDNLDARGFEVKSSEARADGGWDMEIGRDDFSGTLDFRPAPPELTQIVMRFSTP